MGMLNVEAIIMVVALILASILVSLFARRHTRTAVDFYLAGKNIGFFANASAICGDYFSAASFLGVAAAVYASGLDGVWFATGFGAGFVPVLLFIAAPLRRFGEYTIPDFLGARFGSSWARLVGVFMVQVIILFYLAPQMLGAGSTWALLVGRSVLGLSPYETGVYIAAMLMVLYVVLGGMKGTTWNQAIHFWIFFTGILLVLILAYGTGFRYSEGVALASKGVLVGPRKVTVAELTASNPRTGETLLEEAEKVMSRAAVANLKELVNRAEPGEEIWILLPQKNKLHPNRAMVFGEPGHRYNWLGQFSMVLALVLGTSGLPHIMNRYFTNPTGRVARLTTVWVLGLVAAFYILASVAGVAARVMIPAAAVTDPQIAEVTVDGYLRVSEQVMPVLARVVGGSVGLGYVAAGAFAAMFSTIGGLLIASSVSWGHDIYEQYINPQAPEWKKVAVGKGAVIVMGGAALFLGLQVPRIGLYQAYPSLIAMMVTWAFAVAGGAFVPVFLTSIWWKRATAKGVIAGMLTGGGLTAFFIVMNILMATGKMSPDSPYAFLGSLTYPTVFTFPLALLTTVVVSLLDNTLPENLEEIWVRMHGTALERQLLRLSKLSITVRGERF